MYKIDVIGIGMGPKDISAFHMELIQSADILVGGRRVISKLSTCRQQTWIIQNNIDALVEKINVYRKHSHIVVMSSGDPLFHGIGTTLIRKLGKAAVTIYPNVNSIAAGFALIKESWTDAKLISLHGTDSDQAWKDAVKRYDKLGFLTDQKRTPSYIAKALKELSIDPFEFHVIEHIGDNTKERVRSFTDVEKVIDSKFSGPNIVILIRQNQINQNLSRLHLGMADNQYAHQRGLITKSEVRVVSLSKLKLNDPGLTLWDIGSGSGSVSIEASMFLPLGKVLSFEHDEKRCFDIQRNMEKFQCRNIRVIQGSYPSISNPLPLPDRIFIGGGGKNLKEILNAAVNVLSQHGIIVINTVLIETLSIAKTVLNEKGFDVEITQVQISRSKDMPFDMRLEASNPVFIITGTIVY